MLIGTRNKTVTKPNPFVVYITIEVNFVVVFVFVFEIWDINFEKI